MNDLPGGCASLDQLGLILASGEGARAFLQGQLTADFRHVSPTQGLLAAWCNPQGRVLFLMQVVERPEGFVLALPRVELARALKRLKMFVLRAKVVLEDLGDNWGVLGWSGTGCPPPACDVMAAAPWTTLTAGGLTACRLPGTTLRGWLLGPAEDLASWHAASGLPDLAQGHWWAADTALGLPRIEGVTSERFLPQQLNLDRLGVMSFDKGCYPGQEIIARLKYRGQIKARLRGGESTQAVTPGARLYRADAAPGQSVGEVVSVASFDGRTLFTAVVNLDVAGALHLDTPDGPVLTVGADPGD